MQLAILALAVVASANPLTLLERQISSPNYPTIPVLPVPGYNSTRDGFNSLGSLYTSSANQLSAQVITLARTNAALSGGGNIQYNYDVKASLASSLAIVNNLLWQTAFQAEQKVCAIVTSINQQNVNTVQGQLSAGITAELNAIISITLTLAKTIDAIKAQASAFAESEKAVIASVIQAIATAAGASVLPAAKLSAGLSAAGVAALTELLTSVQVAITTLQTTANIDWNIQ